MSNARVIPEQTLNHTERHRERHRSTMSERCYAMAPCYTLYNLGEPAQDIAARIDTAVQQKMKDVKTTFYAAVFPGDAEAAFQQFVEFKPRAYKKKSFGDIKSIASGALDGTGTVIQFASLSEEQVAHNADAVDAVRDRVMGPSAASLNAERVAQAALVQQQQQEEAHASRR